MTHSQRHSAYVPSAEATSAPTAAPSVWPCMDDTVWTYGVRRVQSVEHRNVVADSKRCRIDKSRKYNKGAQEDLADWERD